MRINLKDLKQGQQVYVTNFYRGVKPVFGEVITKSNGNWDNRNIYIAVYKKDGSKSSKEINTVAEHGELYCFDNYCDAIDAWNNQVEEYLNSLKKEVRAVFEKMEKVKCTRPNLVEVVKEIYYLCRGF